ncbi:MAG: glycosyltransferase [Planctomycetota bacterium]|nr:glycosyltransferase [Planctomycetota bacterium]MDA1106545.1 glycosyltransferase [Planctomycetota bacterium]
MVHALGILAIALAVGLVVYAVWWGVVFWHVWRSRRLVPRLRDGAASLDPAPLVSVVIPAHNESERIAPAVAGVLAQVGVSVELIIVLDRCTDDTKHNALAAANGDPRLSLVELDRCPADWAGKCHAASHGAKRARGELLLFTDADVRFESTAIARAVSLARTREAALSSVLPALEVRYGFERRWQPVASFMLMRLFPAERANRTHKPRVFANGQFLLFTRECYEAIGGHAAVRLDLLEDIAFAKQVKRSGRRVQLFAADGFVRTAMYDSADAFRAGWRRIFIESADRRPKFLRRLAHECLAVGTLGPLAALATLALAVPAWDRLDGGGRVALAVATVAGALGLVAHTAAGMAFLVRARGRRSSVFAWPLGAIAVSGILRQAASDLTHRRPIRWGGREYILEPRN